MEKRGIEEGIEASFEQREMEITPAALILQNPEICFLKRGELKCRNSRTFARRTQPPRRPSNILQSLSGIPNVLFC